MKSFFSRLGTASADSRKSAAPDEMVQKQLDAVQSGLQRMRQATGEDFPLLNECTRLAQKMESSVNRMTDAETRSVWKDQLLEVQQELQAATEAMMSRACTSKAGQEEGAGLLFDGLEIDASSFKANHSGMVVDGFVSPPESAAVPPDYAEETGKVFNSASSPLDEDLFSSLGEAPQSSSPVIDPFQVLLPTGSADKALLLPEANSQDLTVQPSSPDLSGNTMSGRSDLKRKKRVSRRLGTLKEKGNQHRSPNLAATATPRAEDKQPQSAPALSTHPADSTEDILLPSLIPDALSPASHVYTNQPTEDKIDEGLGSVPPVIGEDIRALTAQNSSNVAATTEELESRQQRRRIQSEAVMIKGELARLQAAEAEAVNTEDFEKAESLSAEASQLQERLMQLQKEEVAAENRLHKAVQQQWTLSKARAQALKDRASGLQRDSERHAAEAAEAEQQVQQYTKEAEDLKASASEMLTTTRGDLDSLRRRLEDARHGVEKEMKEASVPATLLLDQQAAVVRDLSNEITRLREEQCREALAAKEAALTTAEEELEQRKDSVQQAAAGFDDSLSRLADDERNYRVQEERLQFKQEEQQRREAECAASAESASRAADSCRELASTDRRKAEDLEQEAAQLEARVDSEQAAFQLQQELRAAHQRSSVCLEAARQELETAETAVRELVKQRAASLSTAAAADSDAALAKRRLPKVDADKKAAAAAKDFKEAAKLSAESKSLVSLIQAKEAEAAALADEAASLESDESMWLDRVSERKKDWQAAERATACAQWHVLQSLIRGATQQMANAKSVEAVREVEALQAEIDNASEQIKALQVQHGFQASEFGQDTDSAQAVKEGGESAVPKVSQKVSNLAAHDLDSTNAMQGLQREPSKGSAGSVDMEAGKPGEIDLDKDLTDGVASDDKDVQAVQHTVDDAFGSISDELLAVAPLNTEVISGSTQLAYPGESLVQCMGKSEMEDEALLTASPSGADTASMAIQESDESHEKSVDASQGSGYLAQEGTHKGITASQDVAKDLFAGLNFA